MFTVPLRAQAQQQDVAKLRADARDVAVSNSGDKAKTDAHCQVTALNERLDQSEQEKTSEKKMDLSRLQKKLGPDHIALIHALKDVNPESPDGRELASIIESLDETRDRRN